MSVAQIGQTINTIEALYVLQEGKSPQSEEWGDCEASLPHPTSCPPFVEDMAWRKII